jgi:hypothetical protein
MQTQGAFLNFHKEKGHGCFRMGQGQNHKHEFKLKINLQKQKNDWWLMQIVAKMMHVNKPWAI